MSNLNNPGIYKITNLINQKVYIGQTDNIAIRKNVHLLELKRGIHSNKALQQDFDKLGGDSLHFECMETIKDQGGRLSRERFWINHYYSISPDLVYNDRLRLQAIQGMKVCSKSDCIHQGQRQPLENFGNVSKSPDSKDWWCKDCKRHWTAKYSKTEARRESLKRYYGSEHGKQTQKTYQQTSEKYKVSQERRRLAGKESRAAARLAREAAKEPYIPPTAKACTNTTCIHKGELQPMENFTNSSRNKDGKDWWCKDCKRAWQQQRDQEAERLRKENHRKSPEGIAARKRYDQSKRGKETARLRSARKRADPEKAKKVLARNKLNKAVRAGKIPHVSTQKCSQCREQAEQYHHYLGYEPEHWFDIEPYCAKCHNNLPVP